MRVGRPGAAGRQQELLERAAVQPVRHIIDDPQGRPSRGVQVVGHGGDQIPAGVGVRQIQRYGDLRTSSP
jgi:hypothetical protein